MSTGNCHRDSETGEPAKKRFRQTSILDSFSFRRKLSKRAEEAQSRGVQSHRGPLLPMSHMMTSQPIRVLQAITGITSHMTPHLVIPVPQDMADTNSVPRVWSLGQARYPHRLCLNVPECV
uniref:Uncharacterized protein n=1 Tax=Branchiostoma floridae TaxID=7739 RepID=C3Z5D1_BRAFL|eukprot:XP_002596032.1 hypothetical protein BRAFLDRAFT_66237 [Branchiostoma floridae]